MGNNDQRSKRFYSNAVLCVSFMWQMVKTCMIRLQDSDRGSKQAWSKCILCIPFILRGSPNECWLRTWDACIITTWRLGLWVPLVACNNTSPCAANLSQKIRQNSCHYKLDAFYLAPGEHFWHSASFSFGNRSFWFTWHQQKHMGLYASVFSNA